MDYFVLLRVDGGLEKWKENVLEHPGEVRHQFL